MRPRLERLARSRLFRAAVSLVLLGVIISRLSAAELADSLRNVAPGLLALGVFVFLITNMMSVLKWQLIVNAQENDAGREPVSFFYLTAVFYMGLFFNNFLPTNFGGDFLRVWKLSRVTGNPHEAAGSVFFDRASSTFALLLIALGPAIFELRLLGTGLALAVVGMFAACVAVVLLFASERAARRLGRIPALRRDPFQLRGHLKEFYFSLNRFRRRPSVLLMVLAISLAYQALHVITVYIIGLSLGIDVPVIYYFLFIPVVLAVGMLPISLNGLGVREGAWVIMFTQVGVPSAEAFSMSVLTFLVLTVVSLAGGVFYLFDRARPVPTEGARSG